MIKWRMVGELSEDMKDFFVLVNDGQYTWELGSDLLEGRGCLWEWE